MINSIRHWFNESSSLSSVQINSNWRNLIVSIALSALALISASKVNRKAPGLSVLLRCVPIGIALIWLLKRCLASVTTSSSYTNTSDGNIHNFLEPSYPPCMYQAPEDRQRSSTFFNFNPFSYSGYNAFTVQKNYEQDSPMYQAPENRRFTPTYNSSMSSSYYDVSHCRSYSPPMFEAKENRTL